jgi:hypothetical protein
MLKKRDDDKLFGYDSFAYAIDKVTTINYSRMKLKCDECSTHAPLKGFGISDVCETCYDKYLKNMLCDEHNKYSCAECTEDDEPLVCEGCGEHRELYSTDEGYLCGECTEDLE